MRVRGVEHLAVGRPPCVLHRDAVGGRRVYGPRALDEDLRREPVFLHRGVLGRSLHVRRRLRGAKDVDQLDRDCDVAGRRARSPREAQGRGHPEGALLADDHELQTFGPSRREARDRTNGGLVLRRVQELPVRLPQRVVDLHGVVRPGVVLARAFLRDLAREAVFGLLGVGGSGGDVLGRLGARRDVEELDVEDEHALGSARLALVREVLGNPEASLLADDHQLQSLGPARDHAPERERDGLGPAPGLERRDRAVEHLPVGRPAACSSPSPCRSGRGGRFRCRPRSPCSPDRLGSSPRPREAPPRREAAADPTPRPRPPRRRARLRRTRSTSGRSCMRAFRERRGEPGRAQRGSKRTGSSSSGGGTRARLGAQHKPNRENQGAARALRAVQASKRLAGHVLATRSGGATPARRCARRSERDRARRPRARRS